MSNIKDKLVNAYCKKLSLNSNEITYDMIMKHWNLENKLHTIMITSSGKGRSELFYYCYRQLYECCTWYFTKDGHFYNWMNWWSYLLRNKSTILELGGGVTPYSHLLSNMGHHVTALDISEKEINISKDMFKNVKYVLGDCMDIPMSFSDTSFDAIFSNQMIEHLHPDDIRSHFSEIYRLLKPEGFYYFTTPNGLWGPHDISVLFGCKKSEGMHLKEYTYSEINKLLSDSGFKKILTPLIHPHLTCSLNINPSIINIKYKVKFEGTLNNMLHFLNYIFSKSMAYREIIVLAFK